MKHSIDLLRMQLLDITISSNFPVFSCLWDQSCANLVEMSLLHGIYRLGTAPDQTIRLLWTTSSYMHTVRYPPIAHCLWAESKNPKSKAKEVKRTFWYVYITNTRRHPSLYRPMISFRPIIPQNNLHVTTISSPTSSLPVSPVFQPPTETHSLPALLPPMALLSPTLHQPPLRIPNFMIPKHPSPKISKPPSPKSQEWCSIHTPKTEPTQPPLPASES